MPQDYVIKTDSGTYRIRAPEGMGTDQALAMAAGTNEKFALEYPKFQAQQRMQQGPPPLQQAMAQLPPDLSKIAPGTGQRFMQQNQLDPFNKQANEFLLNVASGASGLPKSLNPLGDTAKAMQDPNFAKQQALEQLMGGPGVGILGGLVRTGRELFAPQRPGESEEDVAVRRAGALGEPVGQALSVELGEGVGRVGARTRIAVKGGMDRYSLYNDAVKEVQAANEAAVKANRELRENVQNANNEVYRQAKQKALAARDRVEQANKARDEAWQQANAQQQNEWQQAVEKGKQKNLSEYQLQEQQAQQAQQEGREKFAAVQEAQPTGESSQWSRLNQSIGVPAKSIRMGSGGTAAVNPGRGLAQEGFTPQQLLDMTPTDQAKMLEPRWNAAGAAVDATAESATKAGRLVDLSESAKGILDAIPDPRLRPKAQQLIQETARQLKIYDLTKATPEQALALRKALRSHAAFAQGGSFANIKGITAKIYRGIGNDIYKAVPELRGVDQHYADLNQAKEAIGRAAQQYEIGEWRKPNLKIETASEKVPGLPNVTPYTPLPERPVPAPRPVPEALPSGKPSPTELRGLKELPGPPETKALPDRAEYHLKMLKKILAQGVKGAAYGMGFEAIRKMLGMTAAKKD